MKILIKGRYGVSCGDVDKSECLYASLGHGDVESKSVIGSGSDRGGLRGAYRKRSGRIRGAIGERSGIRQG